MDFFTFSEHDIILGSDIEDAADTFAEDTVDTLESELVNLSLTIEDDKVREKRSLKIIPPLFLASAQKTDPVACLDYFLAFEQCSSLHKPFFYDSQEDGMKIER